MKKLSNKTTETQLLSLPRHEISPQSLVGMLHQSTKRTHGKALGEIVGEIARATRIFTPQAVLQDDLFAISMAAWFAIGLGWNEEATKLSQWVAGITWLLYSDNATIDFQRLLALATTLTALAHDWHDHHAVLFGERDATLWQDLFERSGDPLDLFYLTLALSRYEVACFRQGHLEESLDLSRQALLLMRSLPETRADDGVVVQWAASGEADVVFSSRRHISQPLRYASTEANYLWNLAKGLAFLGRYTEAQIAVVDAISCVRACVLVEEGVARVKSQWRLSRWCTESSSWVAMPRVLSDDPYESTTSGDSTKLDPVSTAAMSLAPTRPVIQRTR
ncbi:hypothetical protein HGRIS_000309 [Hohenbuehelia grisea]|uniref:Uncharacterized protein n=1 Tax=Hohenbuehelia grisea TaxID=104357 RepID=A0ABR3JS17_9AGAR